MAKNLGAPDGLAPLLSRRYVAYLLGVSIEELLGTAEAASAMYRPFEKSKGGESGKTRTIDNPTRPLKRIQTRVKTRILDRAVLPEYVCGGVKKRSTVTNAAFHLRKPEVVKLDLRSFFPSIDAKRVHKMWKHVFGASDHVASLLTTLSTFENHLPQGSPASSAIANLVALPLSAELHEMCTRNAVAFSIYVDDIILSGECPRLLLRSVIGSVRAHGFHVKSSKIKVMTGSISQNVTGVVVNRRPSVSRARRSQLGAELLAARGRPVEITELRRLRGSVQHVKMVNPRQGRRLENLLHVVEDTPVD
jgi:hypothetical protein